MTASDTTRELAKPHPKSLQPGTNLVSGRLIIELARRKEDDSGWWLADHGGIADYVYLEQDWTPLYPAGVSYCTLHHGVLNEDDDRCDFSSNDIDTGDTVIDIDDNGEEYDTGEPRPCVVRQLYMLADA